MTVYTVYSASVNQIPSSGTQEYISVVILNWNEVICEFKVHFGPWVSLKKNPEYAACYIFLSLIVILIPKYWKVLVLV